MTQTRKATNGHGKAPVKRVMYHEFESPSSPPVPPGTAPIVLDQRALAQLPVWRIFVLLSAIIGGTIVITWRIAEERSEITKEVTQIKTEVKSLASSVAAFSESVKELNGNLKYLSSGTWSRGDMRSFCRNFEAINAGAKLKCPAVELGVLK